MPEPGDVLLGRFRVEEVIGKGGMGHVFRATSLANSSAVAIKVLSPEATTHPEAIPRFINEARATTQLKSVHVVKVFDAGALDSGLPFIAMELLEGTDLGALVEKKKSIPVKEAIDYVIQACDALAEAHALGIVHRDLKPSNLFLTSGRTTQGVPIVKVLDFGVSKVTSVGPAANVGLTATGTFLGSPHYMPPEQLKSAKDVDARADIWSLGVILYELIGGHPPFDGGAFGELFLKILSSEYEPLRVKKPAVPEGVDYIISRCLQRKREDRYPTLGDFVHALAPFGTPEGTARAQRMARALGVAPPSSSNPIPNPAPSSGSSLGSSPRFPAVADALKSTRVMQKAPPPPQAPPQQQPGTLQGMPPSPPPPLARPSSPEPIAPPAAPISQPQLPIGTNAAQQHTIAASSVAQAQTFAAPSGALPRMPPSSPALPLSYPQIAPGQAQPSETWSAERKRSPGASPMVVGIGVGLLVFALAGIVLIVLALRARSAAAHHDESNAPASSASHKSHRDDTPSGGTADTPPTPASSGTAPVGAAAHSGQPQAQGQQGTSTPSILNKRK